MGINLVGGVSIEDSYIVDMLIVTTLKHGDQKERVNLHFSIKSVFKYYERLMISNSHILGHTKAKNERMDLVSFRTRLRNQSSRSYHADLICWSDLTLM